MKMGSSPDVLGAAVAGTGARVTLPPLPEVEGDGDDRDEDGNAANGAADDRACPVG